MFSVNKTENQLLQVRIFVQQVRLRKLDFKNHRRSFVPLINYSCINLEGILANTQAFKEIDIIFDLMGAREAGIIYYEIEMS